MSRDASSEGDALGRRARDWVRLLELGEPTAADADALGRWRRQSPAHEEAFADAVQVWKMLGPAGRAFVERRGEPIWPRASAVATRRAILGGTGALAASAAAWAVISPPLDLWPSLAQLRADYRTATGEQRHVTVADVVVQMNTQTAIAVEAAAGDLRSVRLVSGQASFAMPAQSSQLMIVLAGDGRTVATRARFDVRRIGLDTCVTCLDGEVQVEMGDRAVTVGAGQQAGYAAAGLGPAVPRDPAEVASWQDGFILFRATPLSDAVAEINRYRPGRVVVLSSTLARKTVSGRFRIDRIDQILGWIEQATGATSRALPGGIVLLS